MPYYNCRLAGDDGRLSQRSILASSPGECRKVLEGEGFLVLSVARDWKQLNVRLPLGGRIKDRDIILFNQEFSALLKSGSAILRSLEVISSRTKNLKLKEVLLDVESQVRTGKALSEAFTAHQEHFGTIYIAALMAGEKSGNLPGTLARYTAYAKDIAQTRSRVRSAMAYPAILLTFSVVLVAILITFILPQFEGFYRDFEAELPAISQALMTFALSVRGRLPVLLAAAALLALVYARLRKREAVRVRLDRAKLHLPLVRTVFTETAPALFCRTLGLLLEAGITLLSGVGIAVQAVPNRWLRKKLEILPGAIENGESMTDGLTRAGAFPLLALDMIRIGEASANLQGMLTDVADFYDERVRARVATLVSLIEPVIIILMGVVVAGMLLSIYLPIINIIRVTR